MGFRQFFTKKPCKQTKTHLQLGRHTHTPQLFLLLLHNNSPRELRCALQNADRDRSLFLHISKQYNGTTTDNRPTTTTVSLYSRCNQQNVETNLLFDNFEWKWGFICGLARLEGEQGDNQKEKQDGHYLCTMHTPIFPRNVIKNATLYIKNNSLVFRGFRALVRVYFMRFSCLRLTTRRCCLFERFE